MVAHCAERSYNWLYLWAVSYDAPADYGGEVDYLPIAGDLGLMVVERAFAKEAVEKSQLISYLVIEFEVQLNNLRTQ